MDEIVVSIVVMTYGKFDNIKRNISSIAMQNGPSFEVIISDDHSNNFNSDYIVNLLKEYRINKYTVITNKENIGTVKNYSNAINISKGKYIVPLSQDDYFSEDTALLKIVHAFENNNADYVYTKRIGENSHIVLPNEYDWKLLNSGSNIRILKRLLLSNCVSGSCFSMRKNSFFMDGGFDFDFKLLEDYPFVYRVIKENRAIVYLDEITIVYGENGVSSANSISQTLLNDYVCMSTKYLMNNIGIFNNQLSKDYVKRRYGIYKNHGNGLYYTFLAIKYFRLSLLKLRICLFRKNKDIIFQYLMKREGEIDK